MNNANFPTNETADRNLVRNARVQGLCWPASFGRVGAVQFHVQLLCLMGVFVATSVAAEPAKPNVVYIMADDVGWGDLSVHGGGVPTPNIDRLFSRGVELTQFMGWCVCSPTRAMLLTGRHPIRVGTAPEVGGELDPGETTIAEGFQANGYRTGVFGKWHNGNDPDTPEFRAAFAEAFKHLPNKKFVAGHGANAHGFDEAWIYYGGGADYFNRRTVKGTRAGLLVAQPRVPSARWRLHGRSGHTLRHRLHSREQGPPILLLRALPHRPRAAAGQRRRSGRHRSRRGRQASRRQREDD